MCRKQAKICASFFASMIIFMATAHQSLIAEEPFKPAQVDIRPSDLDRLCTPIHFEIGKTKTVTQGVAPVTDVPYGSEVNPYLCYTLLTKHGQTAHLHVLHGKNTIFSVDHIADARKDYTFQTVAGIYQITVGQLFRSPTTEKFAIEITVR